ncbi:Hypothetical predicted protein, partial [Pelobates cultripes]
TSSGESASDVESKDASDTSKTVSFLDRGAHTNDPPGGSVTRTQGAKGTSPYEEGRRTRRNMLQRQTSYKEAMTPVYNLSNKELNLHHLSVLNKGLTFIPVCKPDPFQ